MATPTAEKLKIKSGDTLLTLHAPVDFKKKLGKVPGGVKIVEEGKDVDQVHWFVQTRAQLEKELSKVFKKLKEGSVLWVYYPKGSSKMQTDLTRDKGWDCLLAESARFTKINLMSFDETWSVFGFRSKSEADAKKEKEPKVDREIFKWVNPATKEVIIPEDLHAALKKNKDQMEYFNSLAYSHKKEYVEWIVTAKKQETREARVKGTLERLSKKWKNPANN